MTHQATTITLADPRDFDGNPYDVAGRSLRQIAGALAITTEAMEPVFLMVRNAEMERQIANDGEPRGSFFAETPIGKRLEQLTIQLNQTEKLARVLADAAEYDPKHPPKMG